MTFPKKDLSTTFSVRIPKTLRDRIKHQAAKDGERSANSLILGILEAGICHLELPPKRRNTAEDH